MTALDLCIILAGPTCGRTLAEYGADVVKIDNPSRENGIMLHEDINRGKRSVLLDLKRDEGREGNHGNWLPMSMSSSRTIALAKSADWASTKSRFARSTPTWSTPR